MSNKVRNCVKTVAEIFLVLVLTAAMEYFYFGFHCIDFTAPLSYSGDGLTSVWCARKTMGTAGDELLGWPYFADTSAYAPNYSKLYVILIKFLGLFTQDTVLVFNLYLFTVPLVNVLVTYLVFRGLKIRRWLAYGGALAFGFCPYVQYRLPGHTALAAVECIPPVLLLCFWCMEDERFNAPGKAWFRYPKNWAGLFFCWMIANNGIVYYPFFSCFLFLLLAFCLLICTKDWRRAIKPVISIVQTAGFLALAFLPSVMGMLEGAGNSATNGVARNKMHAAIYGMRLNALFMSPKGFGIKKLEIIFRDYIRCVQDIDPNTTNENLHAYMGVIAILGFVLLMIAFASQLHPFHGNKTGTRIWLLSRFEIAVILLGVLTGIGTIVAFLVPMLRCYNRISPFLVCIGVFAAVLTAEWLLSNRCTKRRSFAILSAAIAIVFVYALWEQQGTYCYFGSNEDNAQAASNDQSFVEQIENTAGADAMVFQLPYMASFENGWTGNIPDYDHLRGVLYSDTLRWSYGAGRGTQNDLWYKDTAELPPEQLVEEARNKGFSGIWLNLDGYEGSEGIALKNALCSAASCESVIECADGHTIYIPF